MEKFAFNRLCVHVRKAVRFDKVESHFADERPGRQKELFLFKEKA
jgi:hypothetical protein